MSEYLKQNGWVKVELLHDVEYGLNYRYMKGERVWTDCEDAQKCEKLGIAKIVEE